MQDHYGVGLCQSILDPDWIPEIAALGWAIYSKDYAMRTDHLGSIVPSSAKVFLLPDSSLPSEEQCRRYVDQRFRIAIKAQRDGPMLFGVPPSGALNALPLELP